MKRAVFLLLVLLPTVANLSSVGYSSWPLSHGAKTRTTVWLRGCEGTDIGNKRGTRLEISRRMTRVKDDGSRAIRTPYLSSSPGLFTLLSAASGLSDARGVTAGMDISGRRAMGRDGLGAGRPMVELGAEIMRAITMMTKANVVDSKVVEETLDYLKAALVRSDVEQHLVKQFQDRVRDSTKWHEDAISADPERIKESIISEVTKMMDTKNAGVFPVKGQSKVVVVAGHAGAGKTSVCFKYAAHFRQKGFKTGIIWDSGDAEEKFKLEQEAERGQIMFCASQEEDAVDAAGEGVETLMNAGAELILVDTRTTSCDECEIACEVRSLIHGLRPDQVVWVIDANAGQAAGELAETLMELDETSRNMVKSADKSSIIFTKLDEGSMGAGALTAACSRGLPISFFTCGKAIYDLDRYDAGSIVRYMLLDKDQRGFMERLRTVDLVNPRDGQVMMNGGTFTLRDLQLQFELISLEDAVDQDQVEQGECSRERICKVFELMTEEELDSSSPEKILSRERIRALADATGVDVDDIDSIIEQCVRFDGIIRSCGRMICRYPKEMISKIQMALPDGAFDAMVNSQGMPDMMQNGSGKSFRQDVLNWRAVQARKYSGKASDMSERLKSLMRQSR